MARFTDWIARTLTGTRSRLLVSLAVVGGILTGSGALFALPQVFPPNPIVIALEAASSLGDNPFFNLVSNAANFTRLERAGAADERQPATLDGGEAGLFGGSLNTSACDAEKLVGFLRDNPDKGAAWAKVFKISPADIPGFVETLTPVVLRVDTRVTNHGFENGKATPRQSILEAGTAVFVDRQGIPRVRCYCGNPLLPPTPIGDGKIEYRGVKWDGFDPKKAFEITAGKPDGGFLLHNPDTGTNFFRPFGPKLGSDLIIVPEVKGQQAAAAEPSLKTAGFAVTRETRVDSHPAGTILDTRPAPNARVSPGSTLTLVVSGGTNTLPPPGPTPTVVVVPEVVGMSPATARATVEGLGLVTTNPEPEPSDTVPAGQIIRTDPPPGTTLKSGSTVKLFVSTGPSSQKAAVPDVTNLTSALAQQTLEAAGFRVALINRPSATVPAGSVVSTNPVAGTEASLGSAVTVVVSTGADAATVPDVTGKTRDAAAAEVQSARLAVQVATEASSTVAEGTVIRQTPAAGTAVGAGSVVTIVVSSGPAGIEVPTVTGDSEANARRRIEGAGLVPSSVSQPSSDHPKGDVIDQTPSGGTMVSPGATVTLVVSSGPELVGACDLVGRKVTQAKADCPQFALAVSQRNDEFAAAGEIMSQSPAAGTLLAPGAPINVVASLGPQLRSVPDLRGVSAEVARERLRFERLVYAESQRFDKAEAGTVIEQSPGAGTRVARDSTVSVVVSRGPEPVCLRVVGHQEKAAINELAAVGLKTTLTRVDGRSEPIGEVVDQNPECARPGETVNLYASNGVAVPDVIRMSDTVAVRTIRGAGFSADDNTSFGCGELTDVTVSKQTPAGGERASLGSKVVLEYTCTPTPTTTTTTRPPVVLN